MPSATSRERARHSHADAEAGRAARRHRPRHSSGDHARPKRASRRRTPTSPRPTNRSCSTSMRLPRCWAQGPDRGLTIARPAAGILKAQGLPADAGDRPDRPPPRHRRRPRARVEAAAERHQGSARRLLSEHQPRRPSSASSRWASATCSTAGSDFGSVGPAVSLPIFHGGSLQGQYRGAAATMTRPSRSTTPGHRGAARNRRRGRPARTLARSARRQSRSALAASEDAFASRGCATSRGSPPISTCSPPRRAWSARRRTVAQLETRAFTLDVQLVRALGGGFQPPDHFSGVIDNGRTRPHRNAAPASAEQIEATDAEIAAVEATSAAAQGAARRWPARCSLAGGGWSRAARTGEPRFAPTTPMSAPTSAQVTPLVARRRSPRCRS